MFLTCARTFGLLPGAADLPAGSEPADLRAGYQQIEGISLGYLQIDGTPMTTISRRMETLNIRSRRCDLRELRALKAIRSLPGRAVKCSLISKADLEALCSSCKAPSPAA
ncbi:SKDA1 protein, partial [Grantiella picta]|nr:SKDA1 protein [Grantiella picta]